MAWSDWMEDEEWVQILDQGMGGEAVVNPWTLNEMVQDSDWRTQLQPGSRQRTVNEIMETLKRRVPFSGREELNKIAVRFEEEIYTAATSQDDYMRKISLKMLTMESDSQNHNANSLQSSSGSNSGYPQDPASSDSSSQTGDASGEDWQEEIYQKIKAMNEKYFPALNGLYQVMAFRLQQPGTLPQQFQKQRFVKVMLGRFMSFLLTNKKEVQIYHKEKIVGVEKQIVNILNMMRSDRESLLSVVQQGRATAANANRAAALTARKISNARRKGQMNFQMHPM